MLDAVLESDSISDEVIGFHCQQAAEKMLKALLSDLGAVFHKTHELGALMDDGTESLNRAETRALLKSLRAWVEDRLLSRIVLEAT